MAGRATGVAGRPPCPARPPRPSVSRTNGRTSHVREPVPPTRLFRTRPGTVPATWLFRTRPGTVPATWLFRTRPGTVPGQGCSGRGSAGSVYVRQPLPLVVVAVSAAAADFAIL